MPHSPASRNGRMAHPFEVEFEQERKQDARLFEGVEKEN